MFKHSVKYEENFLDTVEEDAEKVFNVFRKIYEEKKDTNISYIKNLEQLIKHYEKYF